ncbi:MAG: IclR family transcriptional regulator [Anaerolineae bacterium]|nr:IclR family transcriptional regulator [Anaerolineae bacterium]
MPIVQQISWIGLPMREIQSLARGLQIVDLLLNASAPVAVTEIAQHLEVDKSTASRLVGTLQNFGYVQQDTQSRGYVVGKRLHSIGWQITNRYALRELAKPHLNFLAEVTGECAHIGVYSSGKAVVTDDVQPDNSLLRVVGNSGRAIYLHNTAVGKALIAFGDFPLPTNLVQVTDKTITTHEGIVQELATVRQQGFAVDNEENECGVCCIASPVFDSLGVSVASIGISGPTVRVYGHRIAELGQMVKQTAWELS